MSQQRSAGPAAASRPPRADGLAPRPGRKSGSPASGWKRQVTRPWASPWAVRLHRASGLHGSQSEPLGVLTPWTCHPGPSLRPRENLPDNTGAGPKDALGTRGPRSALLVSSQQPRQMAQEGQANDTSDLTGSRAYFLVVVSFTFLAIKKHVRCQRTDIFQREEEFSIGRSFQRS